jgi:hypothetical protein
MTDRGPSWLMWNGSGVAVLDCDFFDTSQGTVFQANRGDIHDNLVSGLVCDRIADAYNGCEGISVEAIPDFTYQFNNNLFLHIRYRGEGHGLTFSEVQCTGNLLLDFVFDGGYGLQFTGSSSRPVTSNTIQMGEVRGGRCVFSPYANGNVMKNVGFVGPRPTPG